VTDALQRATHLQYDARNRLTQIRDAADGLTTFQYDAAGQRLSTTDAVGRTTQYGYDALGRVTSLVTRKNKRKNKGVGCLCGYLGKPNAEKDTRPLLHSAFCILPEKDT